MSQKLDYRTITEGDVLMDFDAAQQRRVHYLVVSVTHFIAGDEHTPLSTPFFTYSNITLQPLDSDRDWDVKLTHHDFQKPYCTWRRVA